jgi:hypothetical protein
VGDESKMYISGPKEDVLKCADELLGDLEKLRLISIQVPMTEFKTLFDRIDELKLQL